MIQYPFSLANFSMIYHGNNAGLAKVEASSSLEAKWKKINKKEGEIV